MENPTVTLRDELGKSLNCYIEQSLEHDDSAYALLLPIDTPVEIFAWSDESGEEEPILVADQEELDTIFPTAYAVLQEQNLVLKRTAVTLTVEGDLPDFDEEDVILNDNGADDRYGEEEELDELQHLANFYHKEQEYSVYTPLDPLFILARLDEEGQPTLLSAEEIEELEPVLSAMEDKFFDTLD